MRKIVFLLASLTIVHQSLWANFDKDPLKETQTESVPVTEELLTREGQLAPASPSYPFEDSAGFLGKHPYEKAETDMKTEEEEDHFWDKWFFWKKNDESQELEE